jgi:uncharacterized RDD family membrane protein YckC
MRIMDASEPALAVGTTVGGGGAARSSARALPQPRIVVAGFWRRIGALLVDAVITLPAALVLALITCRLVHLRLPGRQAFAPDRLLDLLVAADPALITVLCLVTAIIVIYCGAFLILGGRTLGMRALGLRLIDVYGEAPRAARVLVRLLAGMVSVATLGLGLGWAAIDRDKRALHDHVAGTFVIRGSVDRPSFGEESR